MLTSLYGHALIASAQQFSENKLDMQTGLSILENTLPLIPKTSSPACHLLPPPFPAELSKNRYDIIYSKQ